jgi:predicted Zn-dependent protease
MTNYKEVVMRKARPLIWDQLESRLLRAATGLPWSDPTHLTLSFAPDGTAIAGDSSVLFQDLDAQFPSPTAWQDVIVSAFQTWAAQTNISIGLVADDGAPFGVAGPMQGNPGFGDIRIGARPMSPEVLAITVPPDPYLSGTLSGDMILNSSADLNPSNLFDVALHEAGLALGLEESTDPSSVMYPVINPNATLSPSDIQNIQALYGTRAPDPNDNSIATPTPMPQPVIYVGTTPLVAYGTLAQVSDTDFYSFQSPVLYAGPVTISLQTSGISFLQPQLEVFDQNHKLVGVAQSTSDLGDIVTVQLPAVDPFEQYYIEVTSSAMDVFGVGRYALSATFDGRSLVNPSSLPSILQGPYESLSADDLAGVLTDTSSLLFQSGLDDNSTFLTAKPLSSQLGYPAHTQYTVVSSLDSTNSVDYYRVQAPPASAGQPGVLTVSLAAMPINGVLPVASVYDANANPVSSKILLNGNGNYVIQATTLTPGATYYLKVSAAPPPSPAIGNFSLVATFGTVPAVVQTLAAGTLSASHLEDQYNLYIAETQLFQFVLSASTPGTSTNAQVSVEIYNSAGAVVYSLVGRVGDTVSGASVLLTPGVYQVTVSVTGASGSAVPSIAYQLTGGSLSDPIGPATSDPVEEPMYPCPGNPAVDCYCYPDGTYSTVPYDFSSSQS